MKIRSVEISFFTQSRDLYHCLHQPADEECDSQTIHAKSVIEQDIINDQDTVGCYTQRRRDVEFIQRLQDTNERKGNCRKQHRRE